MKFVKADAFSVRCVLCDARECYYFRYAGGKHGGWPTG